MKKRVIGLLLAVAFCVSILAGCGASSKTAANFSEAKADMASAQAMAPVKEEPKKAEPKAEAMKEMKKTSADQAANGAAPADKKAGVSAVTTGSTERSAVNAILEQRKIIRNANVTVEVENFDEAYGKIKTLINGFGFIQESNIRTEKVYVDSKEKLIKRGTVVIRVDKQKFEDVLSGISGLGVQTEQLIKTDDVTEQFFDVESRLRLLKYEENRLEQYLNKISDPDTIFKTESRLTDIRHEIESLTGTLKKWSDLVELSTITINMNEKSPAGSKITEVKSYSDRLSGGLNESMKGVVKFFGELLIFIVSALPVLIVLALLVWLGFAIYRRAARAKRKGSGITYNKDDGQSM